MLSKTIQVHGDLFDWTGFIELRKLEAAREIATVMSKSTNKIYVDAETLLMNVK